MKASNPENECFCTTRYICIPAGAEHRPDCPTYREREEAAAIGVTLPQGPIRWMPKKVSEEPPK